MKTLEPKYKLVLLTICVFCWFQVIASESDPVKEAQDHIRSGALFGKNMSVSREAITFEIMKNVGKENTRYCLRVGSDLASEELLEMLEGIGQRADYCNAEPLINVNVGSFSEPSKGEFKVGYSYFCGPLCAASYECSLTIDSGGKLVFQSCEMKWIS